MVGQHPAIRLDPDEPKLKKPPAPFSFGSSAGPKLGPVFNPTPEGAHHVFQTFCFRRRGRRRVGLAGLRQQ
jgi:hypothetical protein